MVMGQIYFPGLIYTYLSAFLDNTAVKNINVNS